MGRQRARPGRPRKARGERARGAPAPGWSARSLPRSAPLNGLSRSDATRPRAGRRGAGDASGDQRPRLDQHGCPAEEMARQPAGDSDRPLALGDDVSPRPRIGRAQATRAEPSGQCKHPRRCRPDGMGATGGIHYPVAGAQRLDRAGTVRRGEGRAPGDGRQPAHRQGAGMQRQRVDGGAGAGMGGQPRRAMPGAPRQTALSSALPRVSGCAGAPRMPFMPRCGPTPPDRPAAGPGPLTRPLSPRRHIAAAPLRR